MFCQNEYLVKKTYLHMDPWIVRHNSAINPSTDVFGVVAISVLGIEKPSKAQISETLVYALKNT